MLVSYTYFRRLYEKYQQCRIWHLFRKIPHENSEERYGFVFCGKDEEEYDFFLYDEDEDIKCNLIEDGGDGRVLSNPNHHHQTWRKEPIVLYVIRNSGISSLHETVLSLLRNVHIQMGVDAIYIVDSIDLETMMTAYEYNCFYDPEYTENENRRRIRKVFTIISCVQHMLDHHLTTPHHIVIVEESGCRTFGCIETMDNLISAFLDSDGDVGRHSDSMLMIKSHAILAEMATYVDLYDNDDDIAN